jgi:hypothetical protein
VQLLLMRFSALSCTGCESGTSCEFDRHFIALALPLAFLREQRVHLLLGLQTQRQVLGRLFYEGPEQWLCRLIGAATSPSGRGSAMGMIRIASSWVIRTRLRRDLSSMAPRTA